MRQKRQQTGKKSEFQLRFLAIFMSVLIITLPFYTANVFAAITFQEVHISGGDGKESFRKEVDTTSIRVKINSPSPVLPTFLEVMNESRGVTRNSPGTARFSQCTTTNPYECSVTLPINKLDDKDRYSVCVNLANVEGRRDFPQSCEAARPVASQAGNIYSVFPSILVDKRGPTVERFSAEPTGVSGGEVALTTTVVDTTGTAAPGCVGLAKIKFYKEDGQTLAENVSAAPPSTAVCPANTTTFHFNADTLPNGASTKICAVPEDAFGNVHPSYLNSNGTLTPTQANCLNITKDNRPPEIPAENFTVMDANMVNTLAFVADRLLDVKITAVVRTHTHLLARANASTASFNTGNANITLACAIVPELRDETTDHVYKCTGTTQLNPDGEKTRSLSIAVADTAKNYAEATTSISFQIDDIPPVVREITATRVFGGVPIIGPASNTLIAVIDETGAGVSPETVAINNKEPQACIQPEAGAYLCNITIGSVDADTVSILVRGKDLADNPMEQGTADILVDKEAPVFVKAQILSLSKTPVLTAGGTAILRLIVQEKFAMSDDAGAHNAVAQIPFDAENPSAFKPAASCQPYTPLAAAAPAQSPSPPSPAPSPASPQAPPETSPADAAAGTGTGPTFNAGTGALVAVSGKAVNENLPNLWQCDWEIFNLKPNADFRATFTGTKDIAGNALERDGQRAITVEDPFLVYTDALGNVHELHPSDWLGRTALEGLAPAAYTINPIMASPVVDARGAAAAAIGVWFDLQIVPAAGTQPDVRPVAVDVISCSGEDYEAGFFAQEKTKLMFSTASPNTAKLRFNLRAGQIPEDKNKFTVACEFSILSKSGNKVSGATKSSAVMEIPLGNVKQLSDGIWDTIVDTEDGFWMFGEWLTTLNNLLQTLITLCSIMQLVTSVASVVGAVHLLIMGIAKVVIILKPVSEALGKASAATTSFTSWIQESFAQTVCDWLTCADSSWLVGEVLGGEKDRIRSLDPEKGRKISMIPFPDPKSSLILSTVTLCVPGILENMNRMKIVQCEYMGCLYSQVGMGMPKFTCDKVRSYEECKFWAGEFFALIPFSAVAKQFGALLKQILTDPLVLASTGLRVVCNYGALYISEEAVAACNIAYLPPTLMRAISDLSKIYETITNWEKIFEKSDACEDTLKKIHDDPRYDKAKERKESGERSGVGIAEPREPPTPSVPSLPPSAEELNIGA